MAKRASWIGWLTGLIILLAGLRMSLPYAMQWYLNRTLSQMDGYYGQVGDVDIMLWRGAYSLEDLYLVKRGGSVDTPLFAADNIDFSLLWSALFNGALVGDITLTRPQVNFVDASNDSQDQTGGSENWLDLASQLFPLKIDHLVIRHGQIRFHNPEAAIDIALHDIAATATNLVNSKDLSKDLIARVSMQGKTAGQGTLLVDASLNPSTIRPTFDVDVQANDVALVNFKNVLTTYAPFDLEAGTLELAMELASDDGTVTGYIKPVLHQVEVFSWKGDIERDGDGFWGGMTEALSAFIAEIFENQAQDQIATRIPIEGQIDSPSPEILPAIGEVISNAFIQALKGDVEQSINLNDATRKKTQEEN